MEPFFDRNAHLGITCGVLAFSMFMIVYGAMHDKSFDQAWDVIWIVTCAVVGGKSVEVFKR